MTVRSSQFGATNIPAPGSSGVLFTVPAGKRALVKELTAVKSGAGAATVLFQVKLASGPVIDVHYATLANTPSESVQLRYLVVNALDAIQVASVSLSSVSVYVSGVLFDLP